MKILIIEDEPKTARFLRKGLSEAGYVVDVAGDGTQGLYLALEMEFDLIVLDVMLPGLDGWQVLARMREAGRKAQVLMLTARDAVHYRVQGFELGADDYVVKPFAFSELLARVRSLLRRAAPRTSETISLADLEIDLLRHARRSEAGTDGEGIFAADVAGAARRRSVIAHSDCGNGLGYELRQRYQCGRRERAPAAQQSR